MGEITLNEPPPKTGNYMRVSSNGDLSEIAVEMYIDGKAVGHIWMSLDQFDHWLRTQEAMRDKIRKASITRVSR